MVLAHLRIVAAEPRWLSASITRRQHRSNAQIIRHRLRAVTEVDTASFDAEVLQVISLTRADG